MFFPKVVLKMASSNGFADFKMVKNVNGGENPVIEENGNKRLRLYA